MRPLQLIRAAVAESFAAGYNFAIAGAGERDLIGNTVPENMVPAVKRLEGAQRSNDSVGGGMGPTSISAISDKREELQAIP